MSKTDYTASADARQSSCCMREAAAACGVLVGGTNGASGMLAMLLLYCCPRVISRFEVQRAACNQHGFQPTKQIPGRQVSCGLQMGFRHTTRESFAYKPSRCISLQRCSWTYRLACGRCSDSSTVVDSGVVSRDILVSVDDMLTVCRTSSPGCCRCRYCRMLSCRSKSGRVADDRWRMVRVELMGIAEARLLGASLFAPFHM
jgi:hypothetical protein